MSAGKGSRPRRQSSPLSIPIRSIKIRLEKMCPNHSISPVLYIRFMFTCHGVSYITFF